MGGTKLSFQLKLQPLTQEERNFIQACVLGDGTLSGSGKYHRLRVAHKIAHREYVTWKYSNLQRLCVSAPKMDTVNRSLRFGTVGHPEISFLRTLWYQPYKQVPKLFQLTEQALAIWFMDDGCRTRKTVNFSVHNFSLTSVALLQNALAVMNIATSIHSDGKGARLYIKQASYPIFKKLVTPYILPCMIYKLP